MYGNFGIKAIISIMKKKHKNPPAKINVNSLYEFFNVYNLFNNNNKSSTWKNHSLTNIKLHIIANECNHVVPIHSDIIHFFDLRN